MQKRINSRYDPLLSFLVRETIVGYYSSSNKLNAIDLEIDEMFRKYSPNPVYVTLDIHNQIGDVPAKASRKRLSTRCVRYRCVILQSGREGERMFKQLNVKIEGLPIEEAGVEHVLRGIRDSSVVSIYNQVGPSFLSHADQR